ncbi:MAG: N-acyl-D-amino-acid deacylase family protein [Thermodesulfobacteriota bacterium]
MAKFDLAILGGTIVDGTGKPGYKADLGIHHGRIAYIGQINPGESAQEIYANGLVVSPGFIDTHSHSDIMVFAEPELLPKLRQGVTTELLGQDGIGAAPISSKYLTQWRQYMAGLSGDPPINWDWRTFGEYVKKLEDKKPGPNLAVLIPQGNIRLVVLGLENIEANSSQMQAMEEEVQMAMEAGAFGISLGMVYLPCIFARRDELIRLFRRCGQNGGFWVVHVRSGGDFLLESIAEVISMAQEADIPLHISHFKAAGRRNWHKMELALEALEKARRDGLEVTFDIYPYTAGSTMFMAILPPWALEGGVSKTLSRLQDPELRQRIQKEFRQPPATEKGPSWENYVNFVGWENIIISSVTKEENSSWVGKSVASIAEENRKEPAEMAFDILLNEEGKVGMILFSMDEEKMIMGLKHPLGMICTDGLLGGQPHPRVYGTYPRILGHYVRERKDLSLPEAIRKMTYLPAQRLGLKDRGLLAPGMAADIVVFNPETVIDRATYENPRQYPWGIEHVIVNGIHSVKDGKYTGQRGGQVLKKR